jgi:hypothetical protein
MIPPRQDAPPSFAENALGNGAAFELSPLQDGPKMMLPTLAVAPDYELDDQRAKPGIGDYLRGPDKEDFTEVFRNP